MKSLGFLLLLALAALGTAHAQDAAQFDIFEYRVEGTTLLPVAAVEQAVYPFLGEKKSIAAVEEARTSLEKAYHDAGYLTVVVSIPVQKVDSAVVRLAVVEAPVGRLRVIESRYFSQGDIKAQDARTALRFAVRPQIIHHVGDDRGRVGVRGQSGDHQAEHGDCRAGQQASGYHREPRAVRTEVRGATDRLHGNTTGC